MNWGVGDGRGVAVLVYVGGVELQCDYGLVGGEGRMG